MEKGEEIRLLAEGLLENESLFIVDVEVSMKRAPHKILVVVDGDKGVSIEDCAALSRKLSVKLDEAVLSDDYRLEVSSPGLDQPLKLQRQYVKNIGRIMRVQTEEGTKEGKLESVGESEIVLGEKKISFNEIKKAFVLVSFK